MSEQEQINKRKKTVFLSGEWARNNFWYLIAICFLTYLFFFSWKHQDNRKFFEFRQKGNGEVLITGLKQEDYANIDLNKEPKYTYHLFGQTEYSLDYKIINWWDRFWATNYYTLSDIKPEIIGKACKEHKLKLDLDGKGKLPVKLIIPKSRSLLFTQKNLLSGFIRNITSIITFIFVVDLFLGAELARSFASFLKSHRQGSKSLNESAISFKDIGGLHGPKEELQEIVSYFRNPQAFWERGAKVPKGILLIGQPGNGKTMLAKALAGECGLPFIYHSASELEKGIVGWGAMEVRSMFSTARQQAQEKGGCFIFIDEIDAIAGKRHHYNSHHETFNELLVQLDGFTPRENVIIIVATNLADSLDAALLRPGRLDRHILVPLPGYQDRKEIIAICLKGKPLSEDVDLEEVVAITEGLSGAQIANVFNEATILSLRYKLSHIDQATIFEAFDRTLMGPSKKNYAIDPQTQLLIAYHEAGHAVVAFCLPETTVKKITIVPRGVSGGYTWIDLKNRKDDSHLVNKKEILAQVTSFLGGRVSEEIVYGNEMVTSGAYDDFRKSASLVRDLVLHYGMSNLGIVPTHQSSYFEESSLNEFSDISRQKIESEVKKILNECQVKARRILQGKRKILDLIAQALVRKNTLQKEEINYIFINQKPLGLLLLN